MKYKLFTKIWINILILLLGNQLNSQSLGDISFGTDSTFEAVTWNIEWFPKNGSTTVDSVSKIIESLDVDLIGIQEVDDTVLFRQMIDSLPDYELFMDNVWFGGLAYIYKTSTVKIQSIYKIFDTAPYWNAFPRSPLVVELSFNGNTIIVINNHFKCCGNGLLDIGNSADEETRRYEASTLLKQYIDANFSSSRVIILGDLNDILTDIRSDNVFQMFLDDPTNYLFADLAIAQGSSTVWSFPGWPSHLDHILITNELITDFSNPSSEIKTIMVDDYLAGGLAEYDLNISDHRPLGLKIQIAPTTFTLSESSTTYIKFFPNPTNGYVTIDLTPSRFPAEVKVSDLNGKVIQSEHYQENKLTNLVLAVPTGIYLLSVESTNYRSVTKLIIK
jgi:endonuclease/exonuclease/phosphatase family metal-dependent hydrolase